MSFFGPLHSADALYTECSEWKGTKEHTVNQPSERCRARNGMWHPMLARGSFRMLISSLMSENWSFCFVCGNIQWLQVIVWLAKIMDIKSTSWSKIFNAPGWSTADESHLYLRLHFFLIYLTFLSEVDGDGLPCSSMIWNLLHISLSIINGNEM